MSSNSMRIAEQRTITLAYAQCTVDDMSNAQCFQTHSAGAAVECASAEEPWQQLGVVLNLWSVRRAPMLEKQSVKPHASSKSGDASFQVLGASRH